MSDKRTVILNMVIIILTIVLFFMTLSLLFQTRPRGKSQYDHVTAENMLRQLERGNYFYLLESKYTNEMLGDNTGNNDAYTVPYAAADYYEAAFNYNGFLKAGDTEDASKYTDIMTRSREAMGKYSYLADDIDAFLTLSSHPEDTDK